MGLNANYSIPFFSNYYRMFGLLVIKMKIPNVSDILKIFRFFFKKIRNERNILVETWKYPLLEANGNDNNNRNEMYPTEDPMGRGT